MILDIFKKKKSVEASGEIEEIASVIKTKIPKNHKHDTPTFIKGNIIGGQFNDMKIGGNKNSTCSSGFKSMSCNIGIRNSCSSYIGVPSEIKTKLLRHPIIIIDSKDVIDLPGFSYIGNSMADGNSMYHYINGDLKQLAEMGYNYEELI